jgi:hypothetical protein
VRAFNMAATSLPTAGRPPSRMMKPDDRVWR